MAAGAFFQRFFARNRSAAQSVCVSAQSAAAASSAPAKASPSVAAVVGQAPVGVPPASAAAALSLEAVKNAELAHALEELRSIRAALAEEEPTLSVPCEAALRRLPAALRGPEWREGPFPPDEIRIPRKELLTQLKAGRVALPLSLFLVDLPAGWLVEHAPHQQVVELDLSRVVPRIPPAWLQTRAPTSAAVQEVGQMGDFFAARRAAGDATPVAPVAPPVSLPAGAATVAPVAPVTAVTPVTVAAPAALVVPPTAAAAPARPVTSPAPATPVTAAAPPASVPVAATSVTSAVPTSTALPGTPVAPLRPVVDAVDALAETPEFAPRVIEEPLAEEEHAPVPGGVVWDGREPRADAGICTVDLNRATREDLWQLPGVGRHVAEAILAYRQAHGAFAGVFELAEVEGIGARLFRKLTGLSLRSRQDRHEVLNALLGLEPSARPTLVQIAQRFSAQLDGAGVVLSTLDGVPLAVSQQVADEAVRYAAIVPQMFRRTRRYFRQLLETDVHCLAVPTARPMLLLVDAQALFVVVVLKPEQDFTAIMNRALSVAHELHWLLDRRAVVKGS